MPYLKLELTPKRPTRKPISSRTADTALKRLVELPTAGTGFLSKQFLNGDHSIYLSVADTRLEETFDGIKSIANRFGWAVAIETVLLPNSS